MATDIREAFEKLKASISSEDARDFHSTTLQDVRSAVLKIEQQQAQRQSLRNMRRIEPFLKFMETYARVIEVCCQGFSPMAWVWGPLKLMLQLASQYTNVFEKLLEAYKQISEELPRIDRLRQTFGEDTAFLKVLGLIYVDITDFHRRAYKFFRRRAWHMIFECTWRNFEHRFGAILASLRRHSDLLDREAASIHFADVKEAALVSQRQVDDTEAQRRRNELKEVQQWLAVDGVQEARLERLANRCQPGSCEWMFRNESIISWLHLNRNRPVLWIKGNPGSGKSVACSQLIDHLDEQPDIQSAFYFCSYTPDDLDTCIHIIRSVAAQLLRNQPDIVTYVYRTYVDVAQITSMKRMKALLCDILAAVKSCRVVLDGIDECNVEQQKGIVSTFLSFQSEAADSCKVLFSSRNDDSYIARQLSRKTVISLRGQTDEAIALYAKHKVCELSQVFDGLDETLLADMQRQICSKAEGMFLWVRLVINELENQTTVQELNKALKRLPQGLDEAYDRILDRIRYRLSNFERRQALQVLSWICCSLRPLRVYEVQDGIAFRPGHAKPDLESRICRSIFELCGPLIEELPDGTVDTVHFSAKEYLAHQHSGPLIDYAMAHRSLAFACISYLNTRIDFIPGEHSTPEPDVIDSLLVSGFGGLDDYAAQFWIDHVLAYMRLTPTNARCLEMTKELHMFATVWKQSRSSPLANDRTSQQLKDLPLHGTHATVREMIEDVVVFWKRSKLHETTPERYDLQIQWRIDNDPTYLTQVANLVSDSVHRLLAFPTDNVPPHLNVAELRRFKQLYASMGFRCRNSGCRKSSKLYTTDQERQLHERSHRRTYKCTDCGIKPSGFSSASALRKHRETYHTKPEDFEVPRAIRQEVPQTLTSSRRGGPGIKPPRPDPTAITQFTLDEKDGQQGRAFGSLENQDVLDNFDFDSFLQSSNEFEVFDPSGFSLGRPQSVEAGSIPDPSSYKPELMDDVALRTLEKQNKRRIEVARENQQREANEIQQKQRKEYQENLLRRTNEILQQQQRQQAKQREAYKQTKRRKHTTT